MATSNSGNSTQTQMSKPKLRESCNSCYQAKVKCDKAHPWCARCKTRGFPCVYSVSLRSGKRRADQSFLKANEAIVSGTGSITEEILGCQNLLNYESVESLLEKLEFLASLDPQLKSTGLQVEDLENKDPQYSDGENRQPEFWLGQSLLAPVSPLATPPSTSLQSSQAPTITNLTASHSPSAEDGAITNSFSRPLLTQVGSLDHGFASRLPSLKCQCFQLALQTLSSVSHLSGSQDTTFDVALQQGKEAITRSYSILRCGCWMLDSILVTVLASLVSRTLSLFRSLCTAYLGISSTPGSEEDDSCQRLRSSTRASQALVTMGAYELDEGDQHRLKSKFVEIELQKAEELIFEFREQLCQDNLWSLSSPFNHPFPIRGITAGMRSPVEEVSGCAPNPSTTCHPPNENHLRLYRELADVLVKDLKMAYEALQGKVYLPNIERRAPWYGQSIA